MKNFNVTDEILDKIKKFDFRKYLIEKYDVKFFDKNCCCPHPDHDDHNPSFSVWTDSSGNYYWCCHSCHIGKTNLNGTHKNYGTDFIALLRWLSDYDGSDHILTFQEAAYKACCYIGINVNLDDKNVDQKYINYTNSNMDVALRCNKTLLSNQTSQAFKYLASRGLDEEDISEWMLGFNGERITFPLFNRSNLIVGFSNRVVGSTSVNGKYINSRNCTYFEKGEYLYGIHKINPNLNYVFVTEGQMDVIGAYKHGLDNVVASLGTAFTEKHLEYLKNFTKIKNIIFVFDSDDAGNKALEKSAMLARSAGYTVRHVELPKGQDLFDYSMECKEDLPRNIYQKVSYYFYKEMKELTDEFDAIMFSFQNRAMSQAFGIYKALSNDEEKAMFNSFLRSKFGLIMEKHNNEKMD